MSLFFTHRTTTIPYNPSYVLVVAHRTGSSNQGLELAVTASFSASQLASFSGAEEEEEKECCLRMRLIPMEFRVDRVRTCTYIYW